MDLQEPHVDIFRSHVLHVVLEDSVLYYLLDF